MRVALIGPVYPYRGGIAHYTTMLARALQERDHELLLVSFKRQYPQWLFPGQSDRDPSLKPMEVQDAKYWIDSLNPVTWLKTFLRIRKYSPDVVVMQWWTSFWAPVWSVFGVSIRLFLRKPLVYICHNVLPHETQWWSPWLARLVLHWGTSFIVQSSDEAESLLSLVPKAKVNVVPHPVYTSFADQVPMENARRQLGVPMDAPVLLFFGIIREYKGLQDILEALPLIRTQLGRVILLIAGEFWDDKQPYLDMIEDLGIADSVLIEDRYIPNERVSLYLSAADVLVAPYRRVTGSAVVQVARGSGCPVITTDLAGLTETIDRPPPEALAQPGDSQSLAETISHYLLEHPAQKKDDGPVASSGTGWQRLVDTIGDASPGCG